MIKDLHIDVLKEIINIGVGKGAEVLNTMVDSPIDLNVPEIHFFQPDDLNSFLNNFQDTELSLIGINFEGDLYGNSRLLFSSMHAAKLVRGLIDSDITDETVDTIHTDVLAESANIIINAVMGTLCNMLSINLKYNLPAFEKGNKSIIIPKNILCQKPTILFAKTNFCIKKLEVEGSFAIFLSFKSLNNLNEKINSYLNNII